MQVELESRRFFSIIASLLVLVLVLSLPTTGYSAASKSQQLDDLNQKINSNKQKIHENDDTKVRLEEEIKQADANLRNIQAKIDELQAQLDDTQAKMGATQAELDRLKTELAQKQRELDAALKELRRLTRLLNLRAKNYYKSGNVSYLEVLLSAKSFGDLLHRVDYLSRIVNQDAELLKQIKDTKAAIETAKAAIENNKAATEQKYAVYVAEEKRLAGLTAEQQAEKDRMTTELESKRNIIDSIGDEQARLEAEVEAEMRDAARLQEEINRSSGGQIVPIVGTPSADGFIWPVQGTITSGFGPRWGRMHEGLDIAVPMGTPVAASKAGVVDYSGWMGGYGYVVNINHGGGVSTRYAHNSMNLVSVGESVSQGQQIASAGSSGNSTGPHVHFEIRFNGVAVDPLNYLP